MDMIKIPFADISVQLTGSAEASTGAAVETIEVNESFQFHQLVKKNDLKTSPDETESMAVTGRGENTEKQLSAGQIGNGKNITFENMIRYENNNQMGPEIEAVFPIVNTAENLPRKAIIVPASPDIITQKSGSKPNDNAILESYVIPASEQRITERLRFQINHMSPESRSLPADEKPVIMYGNSQDLQQLAKTETFVDLSRQISDETKLPEQELLARKSPHPLPVQLDTSKIESHNNAVLTAPITRLNAETGIGFEKTQQNTIPIIHSDAVQLLGGGENSNVQKIHFPLSQAADSSTSEITAPQPKETAPSANLSIIGYEKSGGANSVDKKQSEQTKQTNSLYFQQNVVDKHDDSTRQKPETDTITGQNQKNTRQMPLIQPQNAETPVPLNADKARPEVNALYEQSHQQQRTVDEKAKDHQTSQPKMQSDRTELLAASNPKEPIFTKQPYVTFGSNLGSKQYFGQQQSDNFLAPTPSNLIPLNTTQDHKLTTETLHNDVTGEKQTQADMLAIKQPVRQPNQPVVSEFPKIPVQVQKSIQSATTKPLIEADATVKKALAKEYRGEKHIQTAFAAAEQPVQPSPQQMASKFAKLPVQVQESTQSAISRLVIESDVTLKEVLTGEYIGEKHIQAGLVSAKQPNRPPSHQMGADITRTQAQASDSILQDIVHQPIGFENIPVEMSLADPVTINSDANSSRPEIARQVAQQLADVARKMPDRPVELTLNPEELGRVRLTFTISETGINVAIVTERGETLDLMRRHIETLAQEFRDMGFKDISFDFSSANQNGAGGEATDNQDNDSTTGPDSHIEQSIPAQLSLSPDAGLDLRL